MTEQQPTNVFLELVVAFLAPMFLTGTGGDLAFARTAALATVNEYCAKNRCDLLLVAQILAFGLATLDSLSRSMADDLSISKILRLRGNAVSAHRAGEQCRRARGQVPDAPAETSVQLALPAPPAQPAPDRAADEARIAASIARAEKVAAGATLAETRPTAPQPAASQPQPQLLPAEIKIEQAKWGTALGGIASEVTAGIPNLPPAQQRGASFRANLLSTAATDLGAGRPTQFPSPLNAPGR